MKSFSSSLMLRMTKLMLLLSFVMAQVVMVLMMGASGYADERVVNQDHALLASRPSADEMQAYMLPDGTLPVFCDPLDSENGASHEMCEGYGCTCHDCFLSTAMLSDIEFPRSRDVSSNDKLTSFFYRPLIKARAPPLS